MARIFSHLNQEWIDTHVGVNNGAFWYSKELYENIVPKIKTERGWCLINVDNQCEDNMIVFIHNNAHPESYEWLAGYKNLILVCSQPKTLNRMIEMFPRFHCIYIPLSIDTEYVKKFKVKRKTKDTAYLGRLVKCPKNILENDKIDKLGNEPRDVLLKKVAKYKKVYAIGRCSLEAQCLGCKVYPHDGEYQGVEFKLLDNNDIIPELQRLVDEIDQK